MKVLGIPVAGKELGSSRLRYYSMLENLPEGWTFARYSPQESGDLLYIQKTESREVWAAIKDCRDRGIPIVYDRDDFCDPWNDEHTKIMDAVDAVTMITEGLAKVIRTKTTTPVYHVADGLDYSVRPEDRPVLNKNLAGIITYGRMTNCAACKPYFKRLDLKKAYICDRECLDAKFYVWKLNKVVRRLVKYDVVLCVHADTFRKKYKDAGRAILAMALGLPVIATRNIETERVFTNSGHPELLIDSHLDIVEMVAYLKPLSVRRKISDDLFEYAWANWRPEQVSSRLVDVFRKVIGEK